MRKFAFVSLGGALAVAACGIGVEGAAPELTAEAGSPVPPGAPAAPTPALMPGDDASSDAALEADAEVDADAAFDAGPGAITFVQSTHTGYVNAKTNSVTLTVTAGNALVVATYGTVVQTMSISDTLGNTWTSAAATAGTSCSPSVGQLWYVVDAKGGADTITMSVANNADVGISVVEYAGVATTNALDTKSVAVASASSSTATAPSLTTTGALDVIVGFFHDTNGTGTMAAGTGFAARERDTMFYTILEDDLPGVGPGTHAVTATLPPTKNDACWGAIALALVAR